LSTAEKKEESDEVKIAFGVDSRGISAAA